MKSARLRIILGVVGIGLLGLVYLFILLNGMAYQQSTQFTPRAVLTIMPGPAINTPDLGLLLSSTPTSTPDQASAGLTQVTTGAFVQITGTGVNGLRIRTSPGTATEVIFIAGEFEIFKVIGGPIDQDGHTWWQLTAPYDQSRQGWAAADYLSYISN
jgi:hypothetical protein